MPNEGIKRGKEKKEQISHIENEQQEDKLKPTHINNHIKCKCLDRKRYSMQMEIKRKLE